MPTGAPIWLFPFNISMLPRQTLNQAKPLVLVARCTELECWMIIDASIGTERLRRWCVHNSASIILYEYDFFLLIFQSIRALQAKLSPKLDCANLILRVLYPHVSRCWTIYERKAICFFPSGPPPIRETITYIIISLTGWHIADARI